MNLYDIMGYCFIGVIFVAIVVVSFYIFVYYSHPLDRDIPGIWPLRVVIITGLVFAFLMIFMLPLDYLCAYKASVNQPLGDLRVRLRHGVYLEVLFDRPDCLGAHHRLLYGLLRQQER
jgi:multisubunit Na+/H+ antiporter MnhB subunit